MKKYVVSYSLDYLHRVEVGIEAENEEKAIEIAKNALYEGTIWDDTPEMPLLHEDFEEAQGSSLEFNIEAAVDAFPEPDTSVIQMKRDSIARNVCKMIVDAFSKEECDASSLPEKLREAYMLACQVTGGEA